MAQKMLEANPRSIDLAHCMVACPGFCAWHGRLKDMSQPISSPVGVRQHRVEELGCRRDSVRLCMAARAEAHVWLIEAKSEKIDVNIVQVQSEGLEGTAFFFFLDLNLNLLSRLKPRDMPQQIL